MNVYTHDIPSLLDKYPHLPTDYISNVDLSRRILKNTPIDPGSLYHARAIAETLEDLYSKDLFPLITHPIVESARLRVVAVESAHVTAEYMPSITARLDYLTALAENNRILFRNSQPRTRSIAEQPYLPLQKTVPGHGSELALTLLDPIHHSLVSYPRCDPPAIGSTPPHFKPDLTAYLHSDILDLVIFYNEDFGIKRYDLVVVRVEKIGRWFGLME